MHHSTKIINKRLIDLELSIQELADERGIDRAVLSQLINGHRPHYEHRNWLCLRLGLSKDRLWGKPATRRSYAQAKPMRRAA